MGADGVEIPEGNIAALKGRASARWSGAATPPGSESRARRGGFPRNLGGFDVAVRKGGTAERRKRSEAEGVEESEQLVVADEAGEPT